MTGKCEMEEINVEEVLETQQDVSGQAVMADEDNITIQAVQDNGEENSGLYFEEDEINIDEYEIVRPEFFAHIKEPAFSINEIIIQKEQKKMILLPCSESEITGYRWGRTKDGRRYSSTRSGEAFVLTLCKIMNWNPDYRYKVLGRMVHSKGRALIAFDLMSYECFPKVVSEDGKTVSRRAIISGGWNGSFGPTYAESQRSLNVDTFDDYTVFTIQNKKNVPKAPGETGEK